ncbi:MAG: hypothetical protein KGJ23_00095 [Euryarchaeota archaeon]|nr:hypothetical protein [Euryarchaeota archaeon]MDE2044834.1 hypothetical protein [Thermoplasmata archaeon]
MAPESTNELDAELAFIQKKIADGVAKARKELEDAKVLELRELATANERRIAESVGKAQRDRDLEWERRWGQNEEKAQRELERALAEAKADAAADAERKVQEALTRQETELTQKFRDELDQRNEALKVQLLQGYEKREQDLKSQLALDKKAFEDEARRASDRELARDRRDLEETYQAKGRKREEELREQVDERMKAREAELRRNLEVELRQREAEGHSKLEEERRKRASELEAEAEKKGAQQLTIERSRLETEMVRKSEAIEARLSQESKARVSEEESRLKEKFHTDLERERAKIEADFQTRIFRRGRYAQLSRRLKAPMFPFSAVVGQDKAKRALLLSAIDPSLGGVVLWGPEGNAKFNLILSFAQVLEPVHERLKLGAENYRKWSDEERYLTGRIHFGKETGAYLVDTVLQTAALSLPRPPVKQGSAPHVSHALPPAVLGGLKDEDEEAYHLLSGMTLHVEVSSPSTVEERLEVIRRNLEFRKNPEPFRQQYAREEEETRTNLLKARDRTHGVNLPTKVMTLIARMTLLDHQSANLDVMMEQLARTNAAFEGRSTVESADVMEAADLALLHRMTSRELAELERGLGGSAGDGASGAPAGHAVAAPR